MTPLHNNSLAAEARKKWGQTQAYREYEEKHYDTNTQEALAQGMEQIMAAFAQCLKTGEAADSKEAQSLVGKLQIHITENYYRCTNEILFSLGQMYVADQRFQQNIDKHGDGTAAFIRDAITIYCR